MIETELNLAPTIHPGKKPFHILESQQFSREWLEQELFPQALKMRDVADNRGDERLKNRRGLVLMYEASTRTSDSFASAGELLGGRVRVIDNAKSFSSAVKGESLEDTIRIRCGYYYDWIALRYDEEGGALRAARVSTVPIINAGDGSGQHPTQAALDIDTIQQELGSIDNVNIAFIGDAKYGRTIHSLAYLLTKFKNVKMDFVCPDSLRIPDSLREYLKRKDVNFSENKSLVDVLPNIDIAYITRQQLERVNGNGQNVDYSKYRISLAELSQMQSHARVLHPLPRNAELPPEVDGDPRVAISRQAQNGLFVRMALLDMILN